MSSDALRFPGRASRQRYDQPAPTYPVLMAAPIADFPFVACWTVLGRPPQESEWRSALLVADNEAARLFWIEALLQAGAAPGDHLWPEIRTRLREHRLALTIWGRLLIGLIGWLRRWALWRQIERIGYRMAALSRYTYRHTRKWLVRRKRAAVSVLRRQPRKGMIEDVAASLEPEQRAIFERLLEARRRHLEQP